LKCLKNARAEELTDLSGRPGCNLAGAGKPGRCTGCAIGSRHESAAALCGHADGTGVFDDTVYCRASRGRQRSRRAGDSRRHRRRWLARSGRRLAVVSGRSRPSAHNEVHTFIRHWRHRQRRRRRDVNSGVLLLRHVPMRARQFEAGVIRQKPARSRSSLTLPRRPLNDRSESVKSRWQYMLDLCPWDRRVSWRRGHMPPRPLPSHCQPLS
jgi:hypothetical protein